MRIAFPHTFPAETKCANWWLGCSGITRRSFPLLMSLHLGRMTTIDLNRCRDMSENKDSSSLGVSDEEVHKEDEEEEDVEEDLDGEFFDTGEETTIDGLV
jgi:hypothetical protein